MAPTTIIEEKSEFGNYQGVNWEQCVVRGLNV